MPSERFTVLSFEAVTPLPALGLPQVTYAGHPLYTFEGDQSPGDTTGQGSSAFGAPWFVVSSAGTQITG